MALFLYKFADEMKGINHLFQTCAIAEDKQYIILTFFNTFIYVQ